MSYNPYLTQTVTPIIPIHGVSGQPTNLGVSGQPTNPGVPGQPTNPGVLGQPTNPWVAGQPTNPWVPGQPTNPWVPGQPTNPWVPGQPTNHGVPEQLTNHGVPGQQTNPGVGGQQTNPGVFGQPINHPYFGLPVPGQASSPINPGLFGRVSTPTNIKMSNQTSQNHKLNLTYPLPNSDFSWKMPRITHRGLPGHIPLPTVSKSELHYLERVSTLSLPGEYNQPIPMLRLAPISSLSNQPSPLNDPSSMPPLIRLPKWPTISPLHVSSSGPSHLMIHETSTQAAYANIPLLAPTKSQAPPNSSPIVELLHYSKHYVPPTPQAGSSPPTFPCSLTGNSSASYSLTFPLGSSYPLELPGDSSATLPCHSILAGGPGSPQDTVVVSDNSSSSGDLTKDPSNALKCREYRDRSRVKKEKEMREFQHHFSKNMKLRAAYDKKADTIRKLKAYYIKCLRARKYKCKDHVADEAGLVASSPASTLSTKAMPSIPLFSNFQVVSLPMVTIKSEVAELFIADVKCEEEDDPILEPLGLQEEG